MSELLLLSFSFLSVAFLYATVGLGGGSSYIAILLMTDLVVDDIRFIALICNIIVVAGASYRFHNAGFVLWKKIYPILFVSIPLAFIGGSLEVDSSIYKLIAAMALIMAAVLMLTRIRKDSNKASLMKPKYLASIGGAIGFLSGVIGIGGGIFLSPVLHLTHWQKAKIIAATTSVFILFNSVAGLIGQMTHQPSIDYKTILILGASVLIGGQLGNLLHIQKLKATQIRLATAILIAFVGLRILFLHFNT